MNPSSLIAVAALAGSGLLATAGNAHADDTPLALLLTDFVKHVQYNPYAPHPGVQWRGGKDAGPTADGKIQLPGALGKPTLQATLSVERDAQERTTRVVVLIPPTGRQKPSTQFRQILKQQLEPGVNVAVLADDCSWDEGGMDPWSEDVFMRLTWPAGQGSLFARGRLKAWPNATGTIRTAFYFDTEDPSDLIKQMGCRVAAQK